LCPATPFAAFLFPFPPFYSSWNPLCHPSTPLHFLFIPSPDPPMSPTCIYPLPLAFPTPPRSPPPPPVPPPWFSRLPGRRNLFLVLFFLCLPWSDTVVLGQFLFLFSFWWRKRLFSFFGRELLDVPSLLFFPHHPSLFFPVRPSMRVSFP